MVIVGKPRQGNRYRYSTYLYILLPGLPTTTPSSHLIYTHTHSNTTLHYPVTNNNNNNKNTGKMQYFTLASFVALVSLATADDGPGPTFTISPYGQGDTVCKASALLDPPGQFIVGPGDVGTSRQLPLDTVSSYLTSVTYCSD